MRLDAEGYKIVMHIHDEAVIDYPHECAVAESYGLEKACELMGRPIPWAPGLLLKAEGFVSQFDKKE